MVRLFLNRNYRLEEPEQEMWILHTLYGKLNVSERKFAIEPSAKLANVVESWPGGGLRPVNRQQCNQNGTRLLIRE